MLKTQPNYTGQSDTRKTYESGNNSNTVSMLKPLQLHAYNKRLTSKLCTKSEIILR